MPTTLHLCNHCSNYRDQDLCPFGDKPTITDGKTYAHLKQLNAL